MDDMTNTRELIKSGLDGAGLNSISTPPAGRYFEIHVRGQLDNRWSEWLEDLEVKLLDHGEMLIHGQIVDQSALMGVLNKLSHLNLTLLAVNEIKERK